MAAARHRSGGPSAVVGDNELQRLLAVANEDGGTRVAGMLQGLPCVVWVKLSKGTLALQGMLPEKAKNAPIAVVGGTGAYNGARGTAFATDEGSSKTKIVIDLLP